MTENRKKIKNDIIFVLALVLLIAIGALVMVLTREEGASVRVTLSGEIYGEYPLDTDRTVEIISGENGEYYNILVIEGGKAYVSEANCPGADTYFHKCTNKDPIKYTGESILCKEHFLVIEIIGGEGNEGPDIVS